MIDLSKYDKKVNHKELEEQMKKASENSFDPLPAGDYEVKLEKLELKENSKNNLMISAQYRILNGPEKNKCLFQNITISGTKNDGFMLHQAKELINNLGFDIEFESYVQFGEEVEEIADSAIGELYEIRLSYNGEYPRFNFI